MVNVSGLQRRSTYAEIERLAQLDEFRDLIKTPDRLPKIITDALSMTALDPENEEALIQFEKINVLKKPGDLRPKRLPRNVGFQRPSSS